MVHSGVGKLAISGALFALVTVATAWAEPAATSPFVTPTLAIGYADEDDDPGDADRDGQRGREPVGNQPREGDADRLPDDAERRDVDEDDDDDFRTWFGTNSGRKMHRGVDNMFNVREAYSDVIQGEWEFELNGWWRSRKEDQSDFGMSQSIKYGVTDDFFIGVTVTEPLGYAAYGAGEINVLFHQTFWREGDVLPAFGGQIDLRVPTGYGSSGFDGTVRGMMTKTLFERFRIHMNGYATIGGGGRGDWELPRNNYNAEDIRGWRWGVGPGFDYQLFENTLVLVNYIHQSNPWYGERNQNIIETGIVQTLGETGPFLHTLRLSGELGLDGDTTTPHCGFKIGYEVSF